MPLNWLKDIDNDSKDWKASVLSLYFPYYSSYEALQVFFFFWLYELHLEDNAEFYTVPHYTQVIFKWIIAHSLITKH